jgi:hypothetical protein
MCRLWQHALHKRIVDSARHDSASRSSSRRLHVLVLPGLAILLASTLSPNFIHAVPRKEKPKIPAVRWDEANPGCTFSRSDDGKLHYAIWSGDVGLTLSVDTQELEKVHRRHEPFFAVSLDLRYRGQETLDFTPENISLEFVKHFQVVQPSLDPDSFVQKVQSDADAVDHEAAREVEKHPEQKETKDAYVRAFQKDSAELIEFVSKNSLRPARLETGNPEIGGWVLFSTHSKWIGGWKKQEEFILRVPLAGEIFEFPFQLPPKPGETMLRKRE